MEGNQETNNAVLIIDEKAIWEVAEIASRQFHSWAETHESREFHPLTNWTEALAKYIKQKGIAPQFKVVHGKLSGGARK